MILFVPVAIGTIPLGLYYLIKKGIKAKGIEKTQTQFIFIGVMIMYALIFPLIFFAVNIFKTTIFVPYSALFTLPFTALTAYAIIRYRLMDIRAAIARSLSFSFLVGAFFAIYAALVIFAVPPLADLSGINDRVLAAAGALLAVLLARYVQEALRRATDRFLFQNQVDYRKALVQTSKELSGTINIDDVTKTVLAVMKNVVRAKKTVIFLQESGGNSFSPHASFGAGKLNVSIPRNHLLVKHLEHTMGPLVKDELSREREGERSPRHAAEIAQIEQAFDWLDIAVVLPLYVNKQLTGLIALGDKLAGVPYLQDDLSFLSTLAPQAATALDNARLYQESLEFGQKLQTEVKRATHELEIANMQLRDLDKAKSEFLSIASHQIYTPLTALRGYLSMIREGEYGQVATKQKPIVNILEVSAVRLINLIKNLLDVSRIESGRLELNLESTDFSGLVKELVQDLMPNAINKKIKLQFHEPKQPLPPVVADRERVRQVVLNIIDNAIKYTDQGRVDVRLQPTDHTLTLSVVDTGRGLTPDEIIKLFTKYTRVGGTSRYRKEGVGLGLYVAKQIIREHRGDVEVASPGLDQGSTFYIHLPVAGSLHALKAGEKTTVEIKAGKS